MLTNDELQGIIQIAIDNKDPQCYIYTEDYDSILQAVASYDIKDRKFGLVYPTEKIANENRKLYEQLTNTKHRSYTYPKFMGIHSYPCGTMFDVFIFFNEATKEDLIIKQSFLTRINNYKDYCIIYINFHA